LATITSQGVTFLITSTSTVVLARLLTPADYGLVAMATAITGLGQAFADLGLSEATIQRKDINHHQVSALFWINVAIGLTLMLITVGLAPVLAWFYRDRTNIGVASGQARNPSDRQPGERHPSELRCNGESHYRPVTGSSPGHDDRERNTYSTGSQISNS
jgi:hypothetical protein